MQAVAVDEKVKMKLLQALEGLLPMCSQGRDHRYTGITPGHKSIVESDKGSLNQFLMDKLWDYVIPITTHLSALLLAKSTPHSSPNYFLPRKPLLTDL